METPFDTVLDSMPERDRGASGASTGARLE
jgi:hypothetical protein